MLLAADVVELVAGGHHDGAHLLLHQLVGVLEVDGAGRALLLAQPAAVADDLGADLFVDHRPRRHGLRKRHVDGRTHPHAVIELAGIALQRADLGALAAARTLADIDVAGLLADGDLEVADEPVHALDFRVSVEPDARMLPHFHHARRQDALRAIERGEGLGEARHLAADRGLALHHHHFVARVGDVQRRLDARHSAADHQRAPRHRNADGLERAVVPHLGHRQADQVDGLRGGLVAVVMHPSAMLADVGHFDQVGIQARRSHGSPEGLQMHVRRAGGHHHAVQFLGRDLLADHRLARVRAHVLVVLRAAHAGHLGAPRPRLSATSTVRAMFSPHQHTKTPIRDISSCLPPRSAGPSPTRPRPSPSAMPTMSDR